MRATPKQTDRYERAKELVYEIFMTGARAERDRAAKAKGNEAQAAP